MDGSVDPYTSTAAVAFIHDNDISHIYLPNSSSMMQTELLAILKAFQHAEFHQKSIVIHIDSLGAIQTLKGRQLKDNVKLITTILCTAQAIHESGRRTYINWITSHVGIMGNEEADYTARNTLLLAQVTPPIPFSISGIKSTLKTTSCKVAKNQLHHWTSRGLLSVSWFSLTIKNSFPFPEQVSRKTRNNLPRLRLGYNCLAKIKEMMPLECMHSNTQQTSRCNTI